MKSNLKEGFALPFAVALIAIFTILFGSILTTASFYKKQKLIAIRKIELNEISLIGLHDLSAYIQTRPPKSSLIDFFGQINLQNQIDTSDPKVIDKIAALKSSCNLSQDPNPIILPSESYPETEFLLFSYDQNKLISCAVRQSKPNLVAKYTMTFTFNSGSIDIKGFRAESEP